MLTAVRTSAPPDVASDRQPRARSASDDRRLLLRYHRMGDRAARDRLVERHMPLARRLARRYARSPELAEDLTQVAAIGLIKAIDRFDVDRGLALSTFAVPTIVGELKRYLRDTTWAVRVPRDLLELAVRVERESFRLERSLGRVPSVAELSEVIGVDVEQVTEALEASTAHRALSLDAPRRGEDDEDGSYGDQVGALDHGLRLAEHRADLRPLFAALPDREREILRLRFVEDLTQTEIGTRLGISQMHVSRLIRRALARAERPAAA
ncbi:MAG: polymerase sigma-B factor [Solirubrobacteraceae bacterium]|jgi:RNA polymerase sigma-B factor|nr:polymerase sigma-B factor [Solirubrobacteraceae bacterium]